MKKHIKLLGILALSSVLFWSCDQKKADSDSKETPVAEVANTTITNNEVKINAAAADTDQAATGPYGEFKFEKESHDFGPIKQGDVVEYDFKFENTGEVPLVMSDIKVSCGCTTPSWTKEPVEPGESGNILVKFDSKGKIGQQLKNITITANVETGRKVISIKTNVEAAAVNTATMNGPLKKGDNQ